MHTALPGSILVPEGVRYCVWSPMAAEVTVEIHSGEGLVRTLPLVREENDCHVAVDTQGKAGDAYGFRVNGEQLLPDPVSRAQRDSVHGLSIVIDPKAYQWGDTAWKRPVFRDLVIYELHIGTFTPEGTFLAARRHLSHLKTLGVNTIEIMPIADFPGRRNWGYDGVLIYAPAHCYGHPDDLRALVDAAHAEGIAVILDVVYNHFGPDGNYLSAYSPDYFHSRHHTPWGEGMNFDAENCAPVRDFFRCNPIYWMEEFHIDGFRFDAVHEIQDDSTPHILSEMTDAVHARGGYTVAEDARNAATIITECAQGGIGFDGVWADDFHHSVRVGQTGEQHAYYQDFSGTLDEVVTTLQQGWLYCGQMSKLFGAPRGTDGYHLPPSRFVHCISNHDQTGNRALGERLNHLVSPAAYRALSALLCLTPYTPMLFMGQEWGATTPFLFFTDHHAELGALITEGRRKEFAAFPEFADPHQRERIPDPQAEQTFQRSQLKWDEAAQGDHAKILALYRKCLQLRREEPAFRPPARTSWRVEKTPWGAGSISFGDGRYLALFDLAGKSHGPLPEGNWDRVLSTEETTFGGSGISACRQNEIRFQTPELLLLVHR